MSAYTSAANYVLDTLWEKESFRAYFYNKGIELTELGPLTKIVFEPAYQKVKQELDPNALNMLESQISGDILAPLQKQENFQRMWAEWDYETRETFVAEQSELQLAKLLIQVYDQAFAEAYRQAYENHQAQNPDS